MEQLLPTSLDRSVWERYQQPLAMTVLAARNRAHERSKTTDVPLPMGILKVSVGDPCYPARLARLGRVPKSLWVDGRLPEEGERGIAIVGSRGATRVGCRRSAELASGLVRAGLFVVSGGALGIDAAAHRGALEAGGRTFAVLGCGVDVVYPDRHGELFAAIARSGGLVSEYPPGAPPRAGQFPVRNRIVAALAEAVLVVEARPSSGALITARLGRELGLPVLAVPGSAGTDQLIATGAVAPVLEAADVLRRLAGEPASKPMIPEALAAAVAALRIQGDTAAGLARRLGVSLPAALTVLTEAELTGWVRRIDGGRYEVPRAN